MENRIRRQDGKDARVPRRRAGVHCVAFLLTTLGVAYLAACDNVENPLLPYGGERPFVIQRVTQSYAPDLQWVGGRAAAIGVNRGERAALDSTLVWLRLSGSNDISSPISISDEFDVEEVANRGGQPSDSLEDRVTYTIWVADQSALEAGLDTTQFDEHSFTDTTIVAAYFLLGRSGGGVDVDFAVIRNQTLAGDSYVVTWDPPEIGFRQLAIRNASSGGFSNLLWHVVIPDGEEGELRSPLIIGETPPEAVVGSDWSGWAQGTHTLWATTDEWNGESFGFNSPGYAFFQMFASNFE